jgi:hypothetical protein
MDTELVQNMLQVLAKHTNYHFLFTGNTLWMFYAYAGRTT